MSLESAPKIRCDWSECDRIAQMMAMSPPTNWMLPIGWVRVEQGLGMHAGVGAGTMPLPAEIDVFMMGRTYCSVKHMSHALLDLLAKAQKP